jgi:DNA primase
MAMDQAAEIREKIDIVSFISEYLSLKKAGRNFKTNCPFHNENTPSFVISPERQIWHCFGCNKGGDAFTFLMEYENMEFPEALRALAKKAGVTILETEFKKGQYSEKEKIFTINNQALKFYHYILTELPVGKPALSYLTEKRKINSGIIDTFELGFAPSSGSALSDYLVKKKGYQNKDLLMAGVSFERGGRLVDFFRGRIIFPLFDHRGNVTGFSARALNNEDQPKYINTKETAVYHKGSMFFGLNGAKEEIKLKQDAIIVEGEFDAISLFMEGIKNVVAIKGTALTENQVNLLARFTPKVTLCLDQDNAGIEATKRSLEVIEKKGLVAAMVVVSDAKDPDEAIKNNPGEFKKALRESVSVYDYFIEKFVKDNNKETADGKRVITDNLLPLLSNISNEVVKEHYLKKLSSILDISFESLVKEVGKLQKKDLEDKIIIPKKDKRARREVLEEYLLALIIQNENPKKIVEEHTASFSEYEFEALSIQKLFNALKESLLKTEKLDIKAFSSNLSKELIQAFDTCYLFPLTKFIDGKAYEEEIKKVFKELLTIFVKDKIRMISEEIKTKEREEKLEEVEELKKKFTKLLLILPKD